MNFNLARLLFKVVVLAGEGIHHDDQLVHPSQLLLLLIYEFSHGFALGISLGELVSKLGAFHFLFQQPFSKLINFLLELGNL